MSPKSKKQSTINIEQLKSSIRKLNSICKKLDQEYEKCKYEGKRLDIKKRKNTCLLRIQQLKLQVKNCNV